MRRIAFVLSDGQAAIKSESSGPVRSLLERLEIHGFHAVKLHQDYNYLVTINYQRKLMSSSRSKVDSRIMIVMEPQVTSPKSHLRRNRAQFRRVFVMSPLWKYDNEIIFPWPQKMQSEFKRETVTQKNKACQIASDKYSPLKGENYTLRREILNRLHNYCDTYGWNWDDSELRRLTRMLKSIYNSGWNVSPSRILDFGKFRDARFFAKGEAQDKIAKMRQYSAAIVIENSCDYISEKLIDAIFAGTCPVYVGPDLELFGLPRTVAVECEPNSVSVESALREVLSNPELRKRIVEEGRQFVLSEKYIPMQNEVVFENLADAIAEEFGVKK